MARRRRRAPKPVVARAAEYRNVKGVPQLQARIAAMPEGAVQVTRKALDKTADEFVARLKEIVPVDPIGPDPGALRDSVRWEPGDHDLAVVIVEEGKGPKGEPTAKHVEYGHRAEDGSKVPAVPHFWPLYNVLKKKIRSRIGSAMTRGAKAAFEKKQAAEP